MRRRISRAEQSGISHTDARTISDIEVFISPHTRRRAFSLALSNFTSDIDSRKEAGRSELLTHPAGTMWDIAAASEIILPAEEVVVRRIWPSNYTASLPRRRACGQDRRSSRPPRAHAARQ